MLFGSVNQSLLKYYRAFEKGSISDEDAAPRIKELRVEQRELQKTREDALAELEYTEPRELNTRQVLDYVKDLKALLLKGTFLDQKTSLRSFIKRIDFEPGQVAIHYSIPMPGEEEISSDWEVLSIEKRGGAQWTEQRTFALAFSLAT